MNKRQALEMLPIIQAWAQGKPVQRRVNKAWVDVESGSVIDAETDPTEYRIKPMPHARPFKDDVECWDEMLKHQPFGWVRRIDDNEKLLIVSIEDGYIRSGRDCWSFMGALSGLCFIDDGDPFGVEECPNILPF